MKNGLKNKIMIQRIQSLYLFAITILSIVVFFSPLIELTNGEVVYVLNYLGISSLSGVNEILINTWTVTALNFLITVIATLALFSYKKRMLQIRLCIINMVLMIGFYPLVFIYIYFASEYQLTYHLKIALIFPLINAILSYLAIRAIGRDEAVVKSLNRMR